MTKKEIIRKIDQVDNELGAFHPEGNYLSLKPFNAAGVSERY